MYRTRIILIGATTLLASTVPALAHPDHPSNPSALADGAAHPFSGLDHLLAMLAVGVLAARTGGRSVLLLPALFVAGMAAGGGAAVATGGGPVGMVEQVIAASVVALGLMLVATGRLPGWLAPASVPLFAAFHGYAHLAEAGRPAGEGAAAYAAGMIAASVLLHAAGVAVGRLATLRRVRVDPMWRLAGSAVAGAGVVLLLRTF